MRDQYDFSKAQRGRFFREGAVLTPPVHLEPKLLARLKMRADRQGVSLDHLVDAILRKAMESPDIISPS